MIWIDPEQYCIIIPRGDTGLFTVNIFDSYVNEETDMAVFAVWIFPGGAEAGDVGGVDGDLVGDARSVGLCVGGRCWGGWDLGCDSDRLGVGGCCRWS